MFPETEVGIRELIRAFIDASTNDQAAQAIGDWLMRTIHFCPKPVDVYEAAEAMCQSAEMRREWRPTRDRATDPCLRTGAVGTCSRCSKTVNQLHMPSCGSGLFCESCCPNCAESPQTPTVRDEPFFGLPDLVNGPVAALLEERALRGNTGTEREAARRMAASVELRQKRLGEPDAEPSPEVLASLDERMLADLRERAQRGTTQAQRDDAQRLLRAWEARHSQVATGSRP